MNYVASVFAGFLVAVFLFIIYAHGATRGIEIGKSECRQETTQ